MIYSLFDNDRFFVLGHRGCSEFFPENTMVSFEDCASDPRVDGIELDVRLCRSGEVVVCHDSNLKRIAGADVVVSEFDWEDLKKIDVGLFKDSCFSGQRLSLLEEVFSAFGQRFVYDIELKVEGLHRGKKLCSAVWDLIRKYGLEENIMVSSFNPLALRRFNRVCWYSVPTADIFYTGNGCPKFLRYGQGHIISGSSYLKPGLYESVREVSNRSPMPLIVWTVNTAEDAGKLLTDGNIRGMIGNNPHLLAEIAGRRAGK